MDWERLLSKARFYDTGNMDEPYESDYDTIIRSTLFRRLQDKAQVFPLEDDDYVRTRLTHSLEVSAIGKKLGGHVYRELQRRGIITGLGENFEKDISDILLCAGLIHDIGNPPFGHFGEYAVREWFQKYLDKMELGGRRVTDILGEEMILNLCSFEGNAQSLRLLARTPYLGGMKGFNLTYGVLAAIIKYPVSSLDLKYKDAGGYKKIGYYAAEREVFNAISEGTGIGAGRHPLSYLLEAADDIAYRTSDLEDAMVKKILTLPQIIEAFEEAAAHPKGCETGNQLTEAVGLLTQLYGEERTKRNTKPELTAVQRWNHHMQELLVREAANGFAVNYDAVMRGEFCGDLFHGMASGAIVDTISHLSETVIYTSPVKIKSELFGRRIIDSLLSQFMPAAVKFDSGEEMTFIEQRIMDTMSNLYQSMYRAQSEGKNEAERLYLRLLMVTDYISGMTDNYAKRLYREMFS